MQLQHQHAEAFRHMRYGSKDGLHVMEVWNSRDGVTPFGYHVPGTDIEVTHLPPWQLDRYDPTHVPDVGDWVWIDLHPERALQKAMAMVEMWWDHELFPMRDRYATKEEAAQVFLDDLMFRTDPRTGEKVPCPQPDLVQVTEPLREELARQAAQR